MSLFGRNIVQTTGLLSGFGFAGAGLSNTPARKDNSTPGATGLNPCRNLQRLGVSTSLPVFFASIEASSQSAGPSNLADFAAGLTAPDPIVLFLIGVGLATLGAIGLHRLAKMHSGIPAGQEGRIGGEQNAVACMLVRLSEILISAIFIILGSPLMLLIAIMIRLESRGPAIVRQTRVGKDFRPFAFYKFRTTSFDAIEMFPEMHAYDYSPATLAAFQRQRENDARITRVGGWLRRSALDELPNLLNVLKGEMRLVGPRPPIPEMVKYYRDGFLIIFSVKPGITGLAQISGGSRLSFYEAAEYDRKYVLMQSCIGDISILLKTLKLLILQDSAQVQANAHQ
jgi:lipopolysaccharide/colanic/teichoic acid biosynthesis glycosyltransferase